MSEAEDRPKVLTLDSDEEAESRLVSTLVELGCEVDQCIHPHEALFSLTGDPPDLMLLAIPVAGTSTASFLNQLMSMENTGQVCIVGLLAAGAEQDSKIGELMQQGLRECLRKPVSRDDLVSLLARWGQAGSEPIADGGNSAVAREHSGEQAADARNAAFAAIAATTDEAEAVEPGLPEAPVVEGPDVEGPKMLAYLDDDRREMTIEMLLGKSMMVWMKGAPLPEGAEFTADLEYKDPAPGRNRMIKLRMQLKAGSCNRAGEHSSRASLRVEDVRPGERWNQFSRVCKEILATDTTD